MLPIAGVNYSIQILHLKQVDLTRIFNSSFVVFFLCLIISSIEMCVCFLVAERGHEATLSKKVLRLVPSPYFIIVSSYWNVCLFFGGRRGLRWQHYQKKSPWAWAFLLLYYSNYWNVCLCFLVAEGGHEATLSKKSSRAWPFPLLYYSK